jgi:hypothetical protein
MIERYAAQSSSLTRRTPLPQPAVRTGPLSPQAETAFLSLSIDHGNIVLHGKTLTHDGKDSDPVISPDGNRIVFDRRGVVSPK